MDKAASPDQPDNRASELPDYSALLAARADGGAGYIHSSSWPARYTRPWTRM